MNFRINRTRLITALLALGVLLQSAYLARNAWGDFSRIWRNIGQPGDWRSANFYQGRKFAEYVKFLNETVPETGRVVLPPPGKGPEALYHSPAMQFFLAPRQVINCPDEECMRKLSRENTYILVVGEIPGPAEASQDGSLIMMDDAWGVVVPKGYQPPRHPPTAAFRGWRDFIRLSLWPMLWLAMITASGALLVRCLAPGYGLILRLALGFGLGLSAFSFGVSLLALGGAPVTKGSGVGTALLLLGASLITGWLCRRRPGLAGEAAQNALQGAVKADIWQGLFIVWGVIAAAISVGMGFHTTDEVALWGAKGVGIAASGQLAAVSGWGTQTVAYPLHLPILLAVFQLSFGEALPAAKLVYPAYYLSLMLACYHFLLRMRVLRSTAGLAVLLFAVSPIVFRHAAIAYANLALCYYWVCGVMALAEALDRPGYQPGPGVALLSGVFFASGAWTRPEGLGLAFLTVGLLLIILWLDRRSLPPLKFWAPLLCPLVIYALFWRLLEMSVYRQMASRENLAGEALAEILAGNLHIDEGWYVLRTLFSGSIHFETWGFVGLGAILILVLSLRLKAGSGLVWVIAAGLAYLAAVWGMYYLTSYDRLHDVSWWTHTGLDRMAMPGLILLWLAGVVLFSRGGEKRTPISQGIPD
jgi:hypothetical protein